MSRVPRHLGKPQIRTVGWPATLTKPWTSQVIALTHACFAGCDRSSDWLDLCNLTAVGPRHVQVGNDAAGLADLVARLRDTTCRLFGAPPGDGPPARRSAQAQGPSHSAPGSHLGRAVHRPGQHRNCRRRGRTPRRHRRLPRHRCQGPATAVHAWHRPRDRRRPSGGIARTGRPAHQFQPRQHLPSPHRQRQNLQARHRRRHAQNACQTQRNAQKQRKYRDARHSGSP